MMECYDKVKELHVLELAAIGHLVLLYMESTKIADIIEIQIDFPSSITDKEKLRDDISRKIVDKIYCNPNTKEVLNVPVDYTADTSQYCICKLNVGEIMVYCNNRNCEKGIWFHLERIRMKEDIVMVMFRIVSTKRVVKENSTVKFRDFSRGFEQYGQA